MFSPKLQKDPLLQFNTKKYSWTYEARGLLIKFYKYERSVKLITGFLIPSEALVLNINCKDYSFFHQIMFFSTFSSNNNL